MKAITVGVVIACCLVDIASAQFQSSSGSAFQPSSGNAFGSSRGAFQPAPQYTQPAQQRTPQRQRQRRQPAKQPQQQPAQGNSTTYANGYSQPNLPNNGYYTTSQPYTQPVAAAPQNAATVYPNGYYSTTAPVQSAPVVATPAAPPPGSQVYANGYYVPANTQANSVPEAFAPGRSATNQVVASPPAGAHVYANGYYDSPREQPVANGAFSPGSNAVVVPANATVYGNGYYSTPATYTSAPNTVSSSNGQSAGTYSNQPVTPPAGATKVYANGYYTTGSTYETPSSATVTSGQSASPAAAGTRTLSSIASDGTKYFSDGTYQKPGWTQPMPYVNSSAIGSASSPSSPATIANNSGRYLAAIATDGTRYYSDGTSEPPSAAPGGGNSMAAAAHPTSSTASDTTTSQTTPTTSTATKPGAAQPANPFNLPNTSISASKLTPEQQKYSDTVVAGMGRLKDFLNGFSMVTHVPSGVSPNYDRAMNNLLNSFMDTPNGQRVAYEMGTGDMKYPINQAFAMFSAADKTEKKLTDFGFPPEVLELFLKMNEGK